MVEYVFYAATYQGECVSEELWPVYETRAAVQLAKYKRAYAVSAPEGALDAESMAVCAMADALYGFDLLANGEGGPVRSTSIGSVSVSYGGTSEAAIDISSAGQAKELYRCACLYLDIYRGAG